MAGRPSRSTRQNRPNYQETYHEQPRAKWTTPLTKILAELMVEQVMKGNKQNNSFGKQAWIDMCEEFNNRTGLNWGTEKLKNRYGILRKQYATMKSILDVNDFSWDETQEMVVATDEVWDDYIKTHPDAETIRTNGSPLYKQLCVIFSESGTNENYYQSLYPLEMEEDHKTAVTNEESSSSSDEEEESIPIEKNKSQCTSGRKRNRAGVDDIMLKAILQMVSTSRLRAAAATQSSDRFSITNCVKALDEMEGIDDHLYYMALDLFDKPDFRELFVSLKIDKRLLWLKGKCNVLSSFMIRPCS